MPMDTGSPCLMRAAIGSLRSSTSATMSMIGLARSPGTAVEPT